jgi:hypothetical protein
MAKPNIWIIDTTVFLNILDVPGSNSDRDDILEELKQRIKVNDLFFLPFVVLIESGNPIAKLNRNLRFNKAEQFVAHVKQALNNEAPYKTLKFPERGEFLEWLEGFPEMASREIGFADYSIIKDWEEQARLFPGWSVRIWSLDQHLQGYQS